MREQSTKLLAGIGLLAALWWMSQLDVPEGGAWVHPEGAPPGHVRILEFRASVGTLMPGQTAQLCYGVENARTVRIAPVAPQGVDPSIKRCMDIVPKHTTHYTLLAIGFDGSVATRSFTLPVEKLEPRSPERIDVAAVLY
jgi:hypothetical protein